MKDIDQGEINALRVDLAVESERGVIRPVLEPRQMRMSKFEYGVWQLVKESSMSLEVKRTDLGGAPTHIVITVWGRAARIPSTTNSRLNMFPKVGILQVLHELRDSRGRRSLVDRAINLLKRTHVVATANPEHKMRLEALTRLWNSIPRRLREPLICDKENRWLVTLHLHTDLNRVDSHNLTKPVCDWLQGVGLIGNDKHVDCFPTRNEDFTEAVPHGSSHFIIAMRKVEDVRTEIQNLIRAMLN